MVPALIVRIQLFNLELLMIQIGKMPGGKINQLKGRKFDPQKGITGLETAIILIAIVVVAAVLAYTVLSAGLFSTQKSQEAVYSGLQKVQGAIGVRGSVNGHRDTLNAGNTGSLGCIDITIAECSQGGQADLTPAYTLNSGNGALILSNPQANHLQISFIDQNVTVQDCAWTVKWTGNHNGNNILDYGEKAVITVWLHAFDGMTWGPAETESGPFLGENYVDTGHTFKLELKPDGGATLSIQRITPDFLFQVAELD